MKNIDIIGGGTVYHVRNHLALAATAYGSTARKLANILVDYTGHIKDFDWSKAEAVDTISGKYESRLQTSDGVQEMSLYPSDKIVQKFRKSRKDIFLVAFKTTCGATADEQFIAGLNLLKKSSCNLVLANDTKTRLNMIITPEQARYAVSENRDEVLQQLVKISLIRSTGTFTRSTVVEGESVDWNSGLVPESLRQVVNYCIKEGAYKPFNGSTVGHFAAKLDNKTFLTSKRKSNFNNLNEIGLVKVESEGLNSVVAYGAKPSVGGQSQRIIFSAHPEMDCIVHFHCPPKKEVPTRLQWFVECGSHQCGKNTSNGLKEVASGIKCVYLEKHGPNIVFNHQIDPNKVIQFINEHFDLKASTDEINRENIEVS
jgi:hypothetical protein